MESRGVVAHSVARWLLLKLVPARFGLKESLTFLLHKARKTRSCLKCALLLYSWRKRGQENEPIREAGCNRTLSGVSHIQSGGRILAKNHREEEPGSVRWEKVYEAQTGMVIKGTLRRDDVCQHL